MDPPEETLRLVLKVIVIIGAFLDIVCYKKRNLANLLVYFECFTRVVVSMIPNADSYERTEIEYTMTFALIFVCLYCDQGW